jgi:hypothetical protein
MPVAEKERKEEIKKQEKQVEEKYGETRNYYENISKVLSFYLTGKNWDELSKEEKKGLDKKTLENWYSYFQKSGIKQGSLKNLEAEKLQPLLFCILIVTGTGKVGMEAIKEISKEEVKTTEDIINRVLNWANEKKEKGHGGYFTYFNSLKGYVDGNEEMKKNMEVILKMAKDKRSEWGFGAVMEKLNEIKKEISKEGASEPIMPMPAPTEKELEKEAKKEEVKMPLTPKIEEKQEQKQERVEVFYPLSYKEVKENVLNFINEAKEKNKELNNYFSYADFSKGNVEGNEIIIGYSTRYLKESWPGFYEGSVDPYKLVKRWNNTIGSFAKELITRNSDKAFLELPYDIEKIKDEEKKINKMMLNKLARDYGIGVNEAGEFTEIVFVKNGKTYINLIDLFELYKEVKEREERIKILVYLFELTGRKLENFINLVSVGDKKEKKWNNIIAPDSLNVDKWFKRIEDIIEDDKEGNFLGNALLYLISPKVDEKNVEASVYVEKNGKPIVVKVSEMSGNADNYARLAFYKTGKELGKIETESKEEKKEEVKKTETKVGEGRKGMEKAGGGEGGEVKEGGKETGKREEAVGEKKEEKEKTEEIKEEVREKEDKEEKKKETEGEWIDWTDRNLEEEIF